MGFGELVSAGHRRDRHVRSQYHLILREHRVVDQADQRHCIHCPFVGRRLLLFWELTEKRGAWSNLSGKCECERKEGRVAKSSSGKIEKPCSSGVFMPTNWRKNMSPALIETLDLRIIVRSDARPNIYQKRHS
jgi:hypothetical protein